MAFWFGSFGTSKAIWESGYIEEGQFISSYNSIELDLYETIENGVKSILPLDQTKTEKVSLYISQKNQNHLLADLPYSTKRWVDGLILDGGEFKKISVRHRGDNPNNWLHKKKSWRVKRKKNDLKDGTRVFNYHLPRDTALINTYLGYYIAEKMDIPVPRYKFVELYINDRYEGLYLELEHLDENFLRMNNTMPVNLYKGTPSRTDKPLNQDVDLFGNPYLWEKRAIYNPRSPDDYYDMSNLLNLVRESLNDPRKMDRLGEVANLKKWANFSAYETIMQSWHNYEKNNMYIISDPWIGEIYPIAYDTIFNDTKSRMFIDETVKMDNAAHALIESLSNNSRFLYQKYKILNEHIQNNIYDDISREANRIYALIRDSWKNDPSHSQFVLTNEFEKNLLFTKGMDNEVQRLIERIEYIEKELTSNLKLNDTPSWSQEQKMLKFVTHSRKPTTDIKICFDNKFKNENILTLTSLNGDQFNGLKDEEGCQNFDLIMNSNRTKPQGNRSRVTTFVANIGFNIDPTIFLFNLNTEQKIRSIKARYLGEESFIDAVNDITSNVNSRVLNNKPLKYSENNNLVTWEGDININGLVVLNEPIVIMPGTSIRLSKNSSIIFKNKVTSIGDKYNSIRFMRSDNEPWGVIALIGEKTNNSEIQYTEFSGGSGGSFGGYEFTGMFNIYSSQNISMRDVKFSHNSGYDDLIHVLYSSDISLTNSHLHDARSDAIDIDISDMQIADTTFYNSGNDAIDAMTSVVKITNTHISNAGDKGLSAGESSDVYVSNLIFQNNVIGIQSKDGTKVNVFDTKFIDNNIQLDAYRKNWRYGDGGKINVEESSFISEKNVISAKDKSSIFVSNSSFNHEIDHLKNRKVNIQNSLIFNNEL